MFAIAPSVRRGRRAGALLTAVSLATVLTACGSSGTGASASTSGLVGQVCCVVPVDGGAAAVGGVSTAFNGWDTAMIVWLAPHDAVASQMAGLATTRSKNATVKKLAAETDSETQDRYLTLSQFATAWGQPAPSTDPDAAAGHDHGGGTTELSNVDALQKVSTAGFDKLFLTLMIAHHKAALPIAQAAIDNGTNPEDKTFATKLLSSQRAEIAEMQKALAAL